MAKHTKIRGVVVTPAQDEIYKVLKQFGPLPDHALVPLAQHVIGARQSSSGIRTRRSELENKRLVRATGDLVRTSSGRTANVFKAI